MKCAEHISDRLLGSQCSRRIALIHATRRWVSFGNLYVCTWEEDFYLNEDCTQVLHNTALERGRTMAGEKGEALCCQFVFS